MKRPKQANPQRQSAGAEGFGEQALMGTGLLCGNDNVQEVEVVAAQLCEGTKHTELYFESSDSYGM